MGSARGSVKCKRSTKNYRSMKKKHRRKSVYCSKAISPKPKPIRRDKEKEIEQWVHDFYPSYGRIMSLLSWE